MRITSKVETIIRPSPLLGTRVSATEGAVRGQPYGSVPSEAGGSADIAASATEPGAGS